MGRAICFVCMYMCIYILNTNQNTYIYKTQIKTQNIYLFSVCFLCRYMCFYMCFICLYDVYISIRM